MALQKKKTFRLTCFELFLLPDTICKNIKLKKTFTSLPCSMSNEDVAKQLKHKDVTRKIPSGKESGVCN